MNRQVDVKALVSHIIRGDGVDRCRICMGDTSEGQVFLGDTVLLDGDSPVTLAELLETLTGVEVCLDPVLPSSVCLHCSRAALDAGHFRALCRNSSGRWETTLRMLQSLPTIDLVPKKQRSIYAIMKDDTLEVISDFSGGLATTRAVALRLRRQVTRLDSNEHRQAAMKTTNRCECPDCGKQFYYAHHLSLHLGEAGDNRRACQHCAAIMSRDDLVQHLIEVHQKEPYACEICPALFKSLQQYDRHIKKAHACGSFTCGDCGRTFLTIYAYNAHLSIHSQKTCPGCDKVFRNQPCFLYHMKGCFLTERDADAQEQPDRSLFERRKRNKMLKVGKRGGLVVECYCDHCGKKFSGKKYVKAHIQIVHSRETHKPCIYCGKFLAAAHMTSHVKKHELVQLYTCNYCGIVLKTDLGIKQHLRLHTGEKPYECEHCGESFSASSRRSEHIRKLHKPGVQLKHACSLCPAKFKLPYQLRKHMDTVHSKSDENKPQFKCDKCGEKFGSCRGLIHHSRKHQRLPGDLDVDKKQVSKLKVYSQSTGSFETQTS